MPKQAFDELLYYTVHNYPAQVPFGLKLRLTMFFNVSMDQIEIKERKFRNMLEYSIKKIQAEGMIANV